MARKADGTAERVWRERLKRWVASTQTVADFCRGEGVSIPSFYQWRRKLWGRGTRGAGQGAKRQPASRPIFVPVEVVDAVDVSFQASEATTAGIGPHLSGAREARESRRVVDGVESILEVELPTGVRIRIGAEIDEARLAGVLRAILGAREC